MKFFGGVGRVPDNNVLNFGGDPDLLPYSALIFHSLMHFQWDDNSLLHYLRKYLGERHCLHRLLPTKRAYDRLRPRGHSFELPSCTLELHKRSFIPRCLYKYIWWGSYSGEQLGGIWGVSFGCVVVISSHLLLCIFIVHTQSKDVFVIFVVLCIRLYSYCISFGTIFMFACTSDMCIKLLLTYLLTFILQCYDVVVWMTQRAFRL